MNLRRKGEDLLIDIMVQPRASRPRIGPVSGDRLKVAVTAPPVDGAANKAVIETLAHALGVAKSRVEVVRGDSSRKKTVKLIGVAPGALEKFAL